MHRVGLWLLAAVLTGAGCDSGEAPRAAVLRLATTTSTRDSGLLQTLVPVFEKQQRCRVDVIAVGTGAALVLGAAGDADAVLVHAEAAELAFMSAGHGVRREPVMANRFILLGPPNDPARARGTSVEAGFRRIAAGGHRFVSRGDDSGTHKRESAIWEACGNPSWAEYVEAGRGMGHTLVMASEMEAYVLADEATWWKTGAKLRLAPIVTEGEGLRNPYAVMVVDPARTGGDGVLAGRFADFMISRATQEMIRDYAVDAHRLFQPARLER